MHGHIGRRFPGRNVVQWETKHLSCFVAVDHARSPLKFASTFLPTDRRVGNYRPFVRIWVGQEAHGSEGTDVDFVLNVGKVKEESRKVVVGDYSSSVVPLPNRIRRAFYDGMTDRFLRFSLFESCRTQWNRGAWAASVPRGDLAGRGCASN